MRRAARLGSRRSGRKTRQESGASRKSSIETEIEIVGVVTEAVVLVAELRIVTETAVVETGAEAGEGAEAGVGAGTGAGPGAGVGVELGHGIARSQSNLKISKWMMIWHSNYFYKKASR